MIELFEQFGYNRTGYKDLSNAQREWLDESELRQLPKTIILAGKSVSCISVDYDNAKDLYHFETNYFVGVDWLVDGQAVYVQPKLNKKESQIDYLKMLSEALEEPENLNHLDGLLHIDFDATNIPITQKQDVLSLFLITQFLQILRILVRKGLKKSYYRKTENLRSRVKGKILVSQDIKKNITRGNVTDTLCNFQEYGVNTLENRILKKAFHFSDRILQNQRGDIKLSPLFELISYIRPAFDYVSEEVDTNRIKYFKSNTLFKEYDLAIKFALLILKRYSYNISTVEQDKVLTPPFWIDMSKLFELYVFKKLRMEFSNESEIMYHKKVDYLEPDFLLKCTRSGVDYKMVIDAKYKPKYSDKKIETADARQLSGYARMKKIYNILEVSKGTLIDCVVLFSDQSKEVLESIKVEMLRENEDKTYLQIFKLGLKLPEL